MQKKLYQKLSIPEETILKQCYFLYITPKFMSNPINIDMAYRKTKKVLQSEEPFIFNYFLLTYLNASVANKPPNKKPIKAPTATSPGK